jgi:phage terminase large subunit-like protein
MTKPKPPAIPRGDLFKLAADPLEKSITQPGILNYGELPYPEQIRFHSCVTPGRFISGGNRGGKTDSIVVESIWWATNTHPYLERPKYWGKGPLSQRFVVVDVSKGIEQIMIPKFKRWLTPSMLIDGDWNKSWNKNDYILTFSNGSTIDFVTHGMELSKLGGVPRHIVYFDEEPPRHIFNESMMRLMDYNGMWIIAATPVKGIGWTYEMLWEPAQNDPTYSDKITCFTLSMDQNPYVSVTEELMDFYTMGMDSQERDMREKGSFVARSGLVFPEFSADTHVLDADTFSFDQIRKWSIYRSGDFGWNAPTAWLWHAVSPDGDIITFGEHYASKMTVAEHSAVIHEKEAGWNLFPEICVGDPAAKQTREITGTNLITEYALRDVYINVEGIPKDPLIGNQKMQDYFKIRETGSVWGKGRPKWVILSDCENFVKELRKLKWATYSSESHAYDLNVREEVHKKDDHAYDSARYFSTLMPDLAPVPSTPTGDRVPITISFEAMMLRLREQSDTTFAEDEDYETEWATTEYYEEMFEGAYDE